MIRRRAEAAGIKTRIGNHSLRATGITAYLKNGGTLEKAAAMANHASTRTNPALRSPRDEMSLDEVERNSDLNAGVCLDPHPRSFDSSVQLLPKNLRRR
jgi:hypothetical protein